MFKKKEVCKQLLSSSIITTHHSTGSPATGAAVAAEGPARTQRATASVAQSVSRSGVGAHGLASCENGRAGRNSDATARAGLACTRGAAAPASRAGLRPVHGSPGRATQGGAGMEPRERWGAGRPDSARVPGATAATMSCSGAAAMAATMSCSGGEERHGETAPRHARGPGGVGFERRQARGGARLGLQRKGRAVEQDLPNGGAS